MNYRVRYRSQGILSGAEPGDLVTILDTQDAAHLLDLGLIETEETFEARTLALVSLHDAGKVNPAFTEVPLTDEQRLAPYATGGGWYHFSEGEVLTKLRREEALVKLAALEAARAAGQQPSGQ